MTKKASVEDTLQRDGSNEPVTSTTTPDFPMHNLVTHSQVEDTSDFGDHVFVQMPGGEEAGSTARSSEQLPASKKKPPQTPKKPAHLRKDSAETASHFISDPRPLNDRGPASGSVPVSISRAQGPRKRSVKQPITHEGIASLAPLPDWAHPAPCEEPSSSTWKVNKLPSVLKNIPAAITEKVRSATQSAPSTTIAVMGITGSGKSQFIKHVTGKNVGVSGRLSSCTAEIGCYATWIDGVCVTLIDTPGFDDTNRSEINVLETIACFMEAECKGNLTLNGIIYMHRITDIRMGGAGTRNLRMFKSLCGEDNLQSVVLVTSMWDDLLCLPDGQAIGEQREAELVEKREFWGAMKEKGARVERHNGTKGRALEIVRSMMGMEKITTAIQEQLAMGMTLAETEAGHVVNQMNAEKIKEMKAKNEEAINEQKKINEELRNDMQEAKDKFDKLHLESQHALQEAETLRRQQLSVSGEQKAKLDETMRKLKEKADKAQADAEEQKKNAQDKRDEAAHAMREIDIQVNSANKAIAEREEAAERLKMNAENRRRFWLMGAAQTIGPMIEGFIAAGPVGALAVGVSFVTHLISGFALF